MNKRSFAILLSLSMVLSVPGSVMAASSDSDTVSVEILTEAEISEILLEDSSEGAAIESEICEESVGNVKMSTLEEVASEIREKMLNRETLIKVDFNIPSGTANMFNSQLMDQVFRHTGNPAEGDYLKRHTKQFRINAEGMQYATHDQITDTIKLIYRTDKSQEDEVTSRVQSIISSLDLKSKSDYGKCKAIYDYITSNVTYDYEHLSDSEYERAHTAYAALVDKTAVCEGYASLFYRLAMEAGLDCRIIAGVSELQGHAWNIVKLGDKYYNLDSTWDFGQADYQYFLKGSYDFDNHERDDEFKTPAFEKQYPMSDFAYSSGGNSKTVVAPGKCGASAK